MERKIEMKKISKEETKNPLIKAAELEKVKLQFIKNYQLISSHSHVALNSEIEKKISEEKDPVKISELLVEQGKIMLRPLFKLLNLAINNKIECKEDEPIIASTFAVWREEALKIFEDLFMKSPSKVKGALFAYLVQKIDFELLPEFCLKARTHYMLNMNIYNFGLQPEAAAFLDPQNNKLYRKLVKVICKWLVNLELIIDTLTRLNKYKLLDYKLIDALKKTKTKWKPDTGLPPIRHIVKSATWNMALKIHDKLSSTIFGLLKTFAIYNFPFTMTFGIGILQSLLKKSFVGGVMTVPVMGYFGILIAGIVTAILMQMGENKLHTKKATEDVLALINCFQETNINLSDLLRQIHVLEVDALDPLKSESEKVKIQEKMKEIAEMLVEKKKPVYGFDEIKAESLEEGHYLVDYFKSRIIEDDWVHVTKLNIEKAKIDETLVNSMLNLSVKPPDK